MDGALAAGNNGVHLSVWLQCQRKGVVYGKPKNCTQKGYLMAKKKKTGRPKRKFTDEQVALMEKYALAGCQNNTIATLMDIPIETLVRRFGKLLTKKRCERKYNLRVAQNALCLTHPGMAIFLGKNELGQKDKQEYEHNIGEQTLKTVLGVISGSTKGILPADDPRDSSKTS